MKRFAALALITLLGGCATYDEYAYSDRGYYDDRYEDRGRRPVDIEIYGRSW